MLQMLHICPPSLTILHRHKSHDLSSHRCPYARLWFEHKCAKTGSPARWVSPSRLKSRLSIPSSYINLTCRPSLSQSQTSNSGSHCPCSFFAIIRAAWQLLPIARLIPVMVTGRALSPPTTTCPTTKTEAGKKPHRGGGVVYLRGSPLNTISKPRAVGRPSIGAVGPSWGIWNEQGG